MTDATNWRAIAEANEQDYRRAKRERDEARAVIVRVEALCDRLEDAQAGRAFPYVVPVLGVATALRATLRGGA